MVIDSRTLLPVEVSSDCHLIPNCFGVSNKTVALDGPFDHQIGDQCDSQLHSYFRILVGDELRGDFAFERGSKSVAGSHVVGELQFRIKKPRRGSTADWAHHALGMRENQIGLKGFVTAAVDTRKAQLSMVNSAFLILHYLGRKEIFEPAFDRARDLLRKATTDSLASTDLPDINMLAPEVGTVCVSSERIQGLTNISPSDLRRVYDPTCDPGDGLLDDFPSRCVSEEPDALVVKLPYGNCLRGTVKFPVKLVRADESRARNG